MWKGFKFEENLDQLWIEIIVVKGNKRIRLRFHQNLPKIQRKSFKNFQILTKIFRNLQESNENLLKASKKSDKNPQNSELWFISASLIINPFITSSTHKISLKQTKRNSKSNTCSAVTTKAQLTSLESIFPTQPTSFSFSRYSATLNPYIIFRNLFSIHIFFKYFVAWRQYI